MTECNLLNVLPEPPEGRIAKGNSAGQLMGAVFLGAYIPAHDATIDVAEHIGHLLDGFREYVAGVRDTEQADEALNELIDAINEHCRRPVRTSAHH